MLVPALTVQNAFEAYQYLLTLQRKDAGAVEEITNLGAHLKDALGISRRRANEAVAFLVERGFIRTTPVSIVHPNCQPATVEEFAQVRLAAPT